MKENKDLSFEEALRQLEEIVEKLEKGEIPLEESLKLFEEGIRRIRLCQEKLEGVERRIEKLVEGKEGGISLEPFELKAEESGQHS